MSSSPRLWLLPVLCAFALVAPAPALAADVLVTFPADVSAWEAHAALADTGATAIHRVSKSALIYSAEGRLSDLESAAGALAVESAGQAHLAAARPTEPLFDTLWWVQSPTWTWLDGFAWPATPTVGSSAVGGWDMGQGQGIVVAVIDTGYSTQNTDLAGQVWTNPGEVADNGLDDDGNGFIDDLHGWDYVNSDNVPAADHQHGTHVSGIIAAAQNGSGVVGAAPKAKLMELKVLGQDGSGSWDGVIAAIDYATRNGAQVINLSLGGGGGPITALATQLEATSAAGLLIVCAAGNNSSDNDTTPFYPASYPAAGIVSVAAHDYTGHLASFSNRGATTVDLAAPGEQIRSDWGLGTTFLSGTSMAAPMVAGAAAELWSANPALTAAEVKAALLAGVDKTTALTGKVLAGGRLNVRRSFATLGIKDLVGPPRFYTSAPAHSFALTARKQVTFKWQRKEADPAWYKLYINGALKKTVGAWQGSTTYTLPAGSYSWRVMVADRAGNTRRSS